MQNNHVYLAASLTDVMNLLKQYRLNGILTIRRASNPYGEEARIRVDLGQPVQIQQGLHEELASNAALSRLHSWGMIYFTFHAIESTLRLPSPQSPQSPQSPHAPNTSTAASPDPFAPPRFSPAVTRPLPRITPEMVREQAGNYTTRPEGGAMRLPNTPLPGMQNGKHSPPPDYSSTLLFDEPIPTLALEMAIPSLTDTGRNYPIAQIPRYDRTIYLLIDGRRTIANIAQLTQRRIEKVCNSLYQLKQQELIVIRL